MLKQTDFWRFHIWSDVGNVLEKNFIWWDILLWGQQAKPIRFSIWMFCQLVPCSLMMILWSSTEFFFCKTNRKVISGKTPTKSPWEAPTPKVLNVFDETLSVLWPDTKLQYSSCNVKRRLKYNVYPPSPLCWEITRDIWILCWRVRRKEKEECLTLL